MEKNVWIALVAMAIIACTSISGPKENGSSDRKKISDAEIAWIRSKIEHTLRSCNIPSLAIGIVGNNELAWAEGFGHLTRESPVKMNANALFQIASDTKKITAIIVNNLVAEGKLELEEPVITYLRDVVSANNANKLSGITLRLLLLHKSGIPYRAPGQKGIDGEPMLVEYTEQDIINDLNPVQLETLPGIRFNYSNFGYAVIGYICEKASGQSYAALVKKYIADKYGMKNTSVVLDSKQLQLIAWPYRKDNRNIKSLPWNMGKLTPAGGVYSNIKDISTLLIAQMRAYREFNKSVNENSPLILTEKSETAGAHYGFGLAKFVDTLGVRYGHGGNLDGYASEYVFMPKEGLGIIMLTSSGGEWFDELGKEIRAYLIMNGRFQNASGRSPN
ncbi:MAG: beta-lactamase family protein [Chitinophagaceae bacterium]|nr:beta-lactamase family protein [Chitinophagaceae bacterium]